MIVYHGSIREIKKPDVNHSFRNLDFGQGFYVTTVKEQAERWAKRKQIILDSQYAVVTEFECEGLDKYNVRDFRDDIESWLDFVCACREGDLKYKEYEIIIGKVANDKVYRVVDMFRRGIWDKERTIKEMKIYEVYDQIAFVTQKAIDGCLQYLRSSGV